MATKRNKLVLFVREGEAESFAAIELLKEFNPHIVYRKSKDDETVLPWLSTPTSNYYGFERIKGYVEYERELMREESR